MQIFKISLLGILSLVLFHSCETDLSNLSSTSEEATVLENGINECFFQDYCLIEGNPLIKRHYQNRSSLRSNTNDEFISDVKNFLQNKSGQSYRNLERKYGVPAWPLAHIAQEGEKKVAFIPLAFENSSYTEAVIIVFRKNNDSFKFHTIDREKLNKYKAKGNGNSSRLSLEMALIQLLYFDQELFGTTDCELVRIAERYLPNLESGVNTVETRSSCNWILEVVETAWYVNGEYVTSTWDYDFDVFCDDEGPSDNPNEGGGGGYDPNEDDNNSGGNNGSGTTNPVYEDDIIDNATTPCVKNIIQKIKSGSFGQNCFVETIKKIFNTNSNVNIRIDERNLDPQTDGVAQPMSIQPDPDDPAYYIFNADISLNSLYTGTASEDWILATILHEAIHGYIDYNKFLVEQELLTQEKFDQLFPLYAMDNTGHLSMGLRYVNEIADLLQSNNPSLTRYEALSLSRVGLGDTSFWAITLSQNDKSEAIRMNNVGRGTEVDPSSNQKNCQ